MVVKPGPEISGVIKQQTVIGQVQLRVSDGEKAASFYADMLGFRRVYGSDEKTLNLLSPGCDDIQLVLNADPLAVTKRSRTTGLYHVAFLYPRREVLAHVVRGLLDQGYPLQGASDHGVSEAIYLADPDGNGVELYVDRPRTSWPWQNGAVEMVTSPLDLEDLLGSADGKEAKGYPHEPGLQVGHIHLQVSDLGRSEEFYHTLLGFDVTQRSYPGALFLSKSGYHHHIGLNTWGSKGAPAPPSNSVGLVSFSVSLSLQEWSELRNRLRADGGDPAAIDTKSDQHVIRLRDPDGNSIRVSRPLQ